MDRSCRTGSWCGTGALQPGYRPTDVPFRCTAVVELEPCEAWTRYVATVMHSTTDGRRKHEAIGFEHGTRPTRCAGEGDVRPAVTGYGGCRRRTRKKTLDLSRKSARKNVVGGVCSADQA